MAKELKRFIPSVATLFACGCFVAAALPAAAQSKPLPEGMFTNPLLPTGPDPWVTSRGGVYYYTNSTGTNLTLWQTRDITDLRRAEKKVVWTPPSGGPYSHDIWAPELHYLRGAWYLYFAADAGTNDSHRIFVLENKNTDPLTGVWTMKGQVTDPTNKWAIDPSVIAIRKSLYMVWSGWAGDTNGVQHIYMAQLKNPWTVRGKRVLLSTPQYSWEKVGDNYQPGIVSSLPHIDVNEGPEFLQHGSKLFVVYSAGACWTDYYELGLLEAPVSSNLMKQRSWTKLDHPVFRQSPAASVFGPGHNGFFKSPDGTQDWIIYHANSASGQGCGETRSPRAQPFTGNADGTPDFGTPVPPGKPLSKPSGAVGASTASISR
jgi:GH43 family beta-xylosidase